MLKRFNKKKIKNYVRNTLLKEDDYKDLNLICVVKHGLIIKRYLYILQDYEDNFVVVIIEKNGDIKVEGKFKVLKTGDVLIFNILETPFVEIEEMDYWLHSELWKEIDDNIMYINQVDGLNYYLKYCHDNNITAEQINRQTMQNNVPDIMKYYEDYSFKKIIKDYIERLKNGRK